MEQGLFSRLQNYFDASYGGRYVEHLIKESIAEQPNVATLLFGVRRSDRLQVEYPFKVSGRTRIADLAFLDAETEQPTCLVEIKYDDHRNPKNAAQFRDYRNFCQEQKCKFIALSQHLLPHELQKTVHGTNRLLFSDLAGKLPNEENSASGMLRRFFVDRGLVMHMFRDQEMANLRSFLFRLLNPWGGQGRSQRKDAMAGGVAEAFGNFLKNMNIVAKEAVANAPGRNPTVDFELDPWVRPSRVLKGAKEEGDPVALNAWDAKAGGRLYVFGRTRLDDATRAWLQIEFGIGLEAHSGEKEIYPFTFAAVYSYAFRRDGSYVQKYAGKRILYDKRKAVTELKNRINEVIAQATRRDAPKRDTAKLRKFRNAVR